MINEDLVFKNEKGYRKKENFHQKRGKKALYILVGGGGGGDQNANIYPCIFLNYYLHNIYPFDSVITKLKVNVCTALNLKFESLSFKAQKCGM